MAKITLAAVLKEMNVEPVTARERLLVQQTLMAARGLTMERMEENLKAQISIPAEKQFDIARSRGRHEGFKQVIADLSSVIDSKDVFERQELSEARVKQIAANHNVWGEKPTEA